MIKATLTFLDWTASPHRPYNRYNSCNTIYEHATRQYYFQQHTPHLHRQPDNTHTTLYAMTHIPLAHIICKQHTYTIYTTYTHIDLTHKPQAIIHTQAHITYTYTLHNTCVLAHTHTHQGVHRSLCTTYTILHMKIAHTYKPCWHTLLSLTPQKLGILLIQWDGSGLVVRGCLFIFRLLRPE